MSSENSNNNDNGESRQSTQLEHFGHQVGGHGQGTAPVEGSILISGNRIFKPLQNGERGHREASRYQSWFDGKKNKNNEQITKLMSFLPPFYGTEWHTDPVSQIKIEYLILENMTKRYSKPCVLDLKMGQQSFAPYATKEKQEREFNKYPTMRESGFRFVGMKVYNKSQDSFDDYGRDYGYNMKLNEFEKGLRTYFSSGVFAESDSAKKNAIKQKFTDQLNTILDWFNNQNLFRFYSSSLLLVYDGDSSSVLADSPDIRLIDFAHVVDIEEPDGVDDGYIHGLKHLLKLVDAIKF